MIRIRSEEQGWEVGGVKSMKNNCLALSWDAKVWCLSGDQSSILEVLEYRNTKC